MTPQNPTRARMPCWLCGMFDADHHLLVEAPRWTWSGPACTRCCQVYTQAACEAWRLYLLDQDDELAELYASLLTPLIMFLVLSNPKPLIEQITRTGRVFSDSLRAAVDAP